jgi:hypothetical protein
MCLTFVIGVAIGVAAASGGSIGDTPKPQHAATTAQTTASDAANVGASPAGSVHPSPMVVAPPEAMSLTDALVALPHSVFGFTPDDVLAADLLLHPDPAGGRDRWAWALTLCVRSEADDSCADRWTVYLDAIHGGPLGSSSAQPAVT